MQAPLVALYPGSFDPPTNGHLNIVMRAVRIVPKLVIAVAVNQKKTPLFSMEERVALWNTVLDEALDAEARGRVEVAAFSGLLVDYARERGARAVLRGLRMVSDFEVEFQMAGMNRMLAPEIETLVMMADEANAYISSQIVKEVASLGGDVSANVPNAVLRALTQRFALAGRGDPRCN